MHHSFKLAGIIDYNEEKVVKIKILPSSGSYKHGYFSKHHSIPVGYLFIRLSDFGIMRMEYSYILNPKKTNFAAFASNNSLGMPIVFRDVILYKEIEGQLRLAYLSRFQEDIDADRDDDDNKSEYRYYYLEREFFVSKYLTTEDKFTNETGLSNLYDQYVYNEDFWQNADLKQMNKQQYLKMVDDLENGGEKLEDQYRKNSKN